MNHNDILAARRIISQFEGRADGRHNSAHIASRETELTTSTPELPSVSPVRTYKLKGTLQECSVGDVCLMKEGEFNERELITIPIAPLPRNWFRNSNQSLNINKLTFERRAFILNGNVVNMWLRVS